MTNYNDTRCPNTTHIAGRKIRCAGSKGHNSAHHGQGQWWPNEHGLPYGRPRQSTTIAVLLVGAIGGLFMIAIYFLLYYHR